MKNGINVIVVMVVLGSGLGMTVCADRSPSSVEVVEEFGCLNPQRFESAIEAYEESDQVEFPERNGIVCLGSSSMVCWQDWITEDLAPFNVIPRGFGGSCISDVIYYADRIVFPYEPAGILLYEGDNDIALGVSPQAYLKQVMKFVGMINERFPTCEIYLLSTKPSPARWELWEEVQAANDLVRLFCEENDGLHFVDVASVLLNEDGNPISDVFQEDGLHMNRKGYLLWRDVMRQELFGDRFRMCSHSN